jgi:hypothetical protein
MKYNFLAAGQKDVVNKNQFCRIPAGIPGDLNTIAELENVALDIHLP